MVTLGSMVRPTRICLPIQQGHNAPRPENQHAQSDHHMNLGSIRNDALKTCQQGQFSPKGREPCSGRDDQLGRRFQITAHDLQMTNRQHDKAHDDRRGIQVHNMQKQGTKHRCGHCQKMGAMELTLKFSRGVCQLKTQIQTLCHQKGDNPGADRKPTKEMRFQKIHTRCRYP
ncbi:hypothetical protein FQZ97_1084150 [compost metagenome]